MTANTSPPRASGGPEGAAAAQPVAAPSTHSHRYVELIHDDETGMRVRCTCGHEIVIHLNAGKWSVIE